MVKITSTSFIIVKKFLVTYLKTLSLAQPNMQPKNNTEQTIEIKVDNSDQNKRVQVSMVLPTVPIKIDLVPAHEESVQFPVAFIEEDEDNDRSVWNASPEPVTGSTHASPAEPANSSLSAQSSPEI